ncbi:site-specific DNA-methyltransferase [Nocardioides sp. LHD-245]|uniref:DNA-methyltransferase n=1 Tax=Nocardioides sp. LHD-245 TaxID=3051387 RepID=UPI0027DF835E|nr:site-specific DNA-methyltransferase [Nocardioides sp. LHD-245]
MKRRSRPRHTPRNQILAGDALDRLERLEDHSVDAIVTSPPYFRLRDYGHPGQVGLEHHIDDWADALQKVLREAARILVPTGSIWLNLGDSYSTHPREGAPRKSLLLGPQRLALRLLADGWTVRNVVVWAKTNPIPSSVRDRLSTTHEIIYLLTRQPRYYFDLDALRAPHTSQLRPRRAGRAPTAERPAWLGPNADGDRGLDALHAAGRAGHPLGKNPGDVWQLPAGGYRGAHFATYPERLARRMVEASTPRMRCTRCRAPWTRAVIRHGHQAWRAPPRPTCSCASNAEPGIVLDPFIGAGTTAIAAAKLGRDWLGIELSDDYIRLALDRYRREVRSGRPEPNQQAPGKEVT